MSSSVPHWIWYIINFLKYFVNSKSVRNTNFDQRVWIFRTVPYYEIYPDLNDRKRSNIHSNSLRFTHDLSTTMTILLRMAAPLMKSILEVMPVFRSCFLNSNRTLTSRGGSDRLFLEAMRWNTPLHSSSRPLDSSHLGDSGSSLRFLNN